MGGLGTDTGSVQVSLQRLLLGLAAHCEHNTAHPALSWINHQKKNNRKGFRSLMWHKGAGGGAAMLRNGFGSLLQLWGVFGLVFTTSS